MKTYELSQQACDGRYTASQIGNAWIAHNSESRLAMAGIQLSQCIPLFDGESPIISTPFMNIPNDLTRWVIRCPIAGRVYRLHANQNRYIIFVVSENRIWATVFKRWLSVTEIYGRKVEDLAGDYVAEPGTVIAAPSWCMSNGVYNPRVYKFGINLLTYPTAYYDRTHKDAVCLSRAAWRKMAYPLAHNISINLATDQRMKAIFENREFLPRIGERINDALVAVVSRSNQVLLNCTADNGYELGDKRYYSMFSEGFVADIQMWPGADCQLTFPDDNKDFWMRVKEFFDQPGINSKEFLGECGWLKWAAEVYSGAGVSSPEITFNGQQIKNAVLDIVIATEARPQPGSKLTGLGGNKGVISEIIPTEEMPLMEDGSRVELLMYQPSSVQRNIVGVMLESAWNGLSRFLVHKMHHMKSQKERIALLRDYYYQMQISDHGEFAMRLKRDDELSQRMLRMVMTTRRIPLIMEPYKAAYGKKLYAMYRRYNYKPLKVSPMLPDREGRLNIMRETVRPVIAADNYIFMVRHEALPKATGSGFSGPSYKLGAIRSQKDKGITQRPRFGELEGGAASQMGNAEAVIGMRTLQSVYARELVMTKQWEAAADRGEIVADLTTADLPPVTDTMQAVRAVWHTAGIGTNLDDDDDEGAVE